MPENVRSAIDVAKTKKKHSDFYYKLRVLNEKIHIFTHVFYGKMPNYQIFWEKKKEKELKEQLIREKEKIEEELRLLEIAEKRKKKRLASLELEGYQKGGLLESLQKKNKVRKINKAQSTFNVNILKGVKRDQEPSVKKGSLEFNELQPPAGRKRISRALSSLGNEQNLMMQERKIKEKKISDMNLS